MTLNILIAPSRFKESLNAEEAANCIATGILKVLTDVHIYKAPLVDGGEGFTQALVKATGGTLHPIHVTGPVGQTVESYFGFLGGGGGKTAVLEMTAAAGLHLTPPNMQEALVTTTYGVGELIKAALDAGAERILVGCGDSGAYDGGAGMAQALGVKLLDGAGRLLGFGGGELARLKQIDFSQRDPRLAEVEIDVACNWCDVLCGPQGVARRIGLEKGAAAEIAAPLAEALECYAETIAVDLAVEIREMPGSGASGGLGTGLYALIGAKLHPCHEIVMQYLGIDNLLSEVDLVITADGYIDDQTPRGKIPVEVARRAKRYNLPVIMLVGAIGQGAEVNLHHGIDYFTSILAYPCPFNEAIAQTSTLLTNAAEQIARLLLVGRQVRRCTFSGW